MTARFEVVSTRTVGQPGEKKHVAYSVLVKTPTDIAPMVIERRYTDFLELYRSLRHENLTPLTNSIVFPKKVIIGNFASSVISARRASFEAFLKLISDHERLRESAGMKKFLIGIEEKEALKLLKMECYNLAKPLLIKVFSLLNKIYTDRHPSVLVALCRLAACCNADPTALVDAEKYGELALRRYETVSDIDLLTFYVPLLQMCVHLWWTLGRDKVLLEARLNDMRRQGHRVDGCPKLLDAIINANY